jgi:hypothetical protein
MQAVRLLRQSDIAETGRLEDTVRERLARELDENPVGRHFLAGGHPPETISVDEYTSTVRAHLQALAEVVVLIASEVDKLKTQDASR